MVHESNSSSSGVVNEAFDDDDELEVNISYAKWINKEEDGIQLKYKKKYGEVTRELSDSFKNLATDTSVVDDTAEESNTERDDDVYRRPSASVSRADILAKLSNINSKGSIGEKEPKSIISIRDDVSSIGISETVFLFLMPNIGIGLYI